jgi:hypothetical protein
MSLNILKAIVNKAYVKVISNYIKANKSGLNSLLK